LVGHRADLARVLEDAGDERLGDNLYTASVLALDPATGMLKWYYQFTPHDLHDWDATETPVLVDAQFHGEPRKLMLQGNRNGFFYVLDRITGKVLLAEPFVKKITWASGIGPDGRPQLLPGNEPTVEGQLVCPAVAGAANWPSNAYNPVTGLFYMFAEESCNIYSKNDQWWEAGKSFYGGGTRRAPSVGGPSGPDGKFLKAIDIQTGKIAWEIPDIGGGILASGLMATAGGLIFYGDGGGAFIAAAGLLQRARERRPSSTATRSRARSPGRRLRPPLERGRGGGRSRGDRQGGRSRRGRRAGARARPGAAARAGGSLSGARRHPPGRLQGTNPGWPGGHERGHPGDGDISRRGRRVDDGRRV